MKRLLAVATFSIVFVIAAGWPQPSRSQDATAALESLTGEWSLAVRETEARGAIERAIERAVDGMLPFVRGAAQGELRARTPVDRQVAIALAGERVEVRLGPNEFATAIGQPRRVPVPGYDGESVEIVHLVREGRLEQVFTTERGRRWNVFAASADGSRLTMDVTMNGSFLPAPVQYRLEYRRAQ